MLNYTTLFKILLHFTAFCAMMFMNTISLRHRVI